MTTLKYNAVLIALILLIFSSCVPVKRMAYVQSDADLHPSQMIFTGQQVDNTIRPGDEIFIRISSADEQPTALTQDMQRGTFNPSFMSYTVNEDGTIRLPYIGRINLYNLTLEQASEKVEAALGQYLFLPNVYMRFINTRVTVLGEVNRPGLYLFDYKNINMFQALGFAGDISEFGNRRKVLLIREDGAIKSKHFLDLTQDSFLESEFYNLQSGDIVYIEPLGRRVWGITTFPYNLLTTIISTSILVYTVFF